MPTASQVDSEELGPIPNQYIVVYKDRWNGVINTDIADKVRAFVDKRLSEYGVPDSLVRSRYEHALRGFSATLTDQQLQTIQNDPKVKYLEQNRRFQAIQTSSPTPVELSNTPRKNNNTMLSTQSTPWGVTRVDGPLSATYKTAWILDTGIDLDHDDLNVNNNKSISFVSGESANDLNGHGTHVAGTIAAIDNNIDVVGVAAGATVISVKVLDSNGGGKTDEVIDGVDHVAAHASSSNIVNMSLGAEDPKNELNALDDAVTSAANNGIRFAIAAGNESDDANNFSPARVEHHRVWTVSAYREGDEFIQTFDWNTPNCNPFQNPDKGSNYGNPPIEYSAPGESILSLWKDNTTLTTCGTSMAAPHVAGLLLVTPNGIGSNDFVANDPDGDPDPIAEAVLAVTTSGPNSLDSGEEGTWTAQTENDNGSISYQWYYKEDYNDSWHAAGSDSDTFSHTFFNNTSTVNSAEVRVDVTSGSENASAKQDVAVKSGQSDCGDKIICT